jgi:hypothetical protein
VSTTYDYDITNDTVNGRANVEVLIRAILSANLASGGNFEGAEIDGGTLNSDLAGTIDDGTLTVTWENTLSGSDETDQDAIVNAHTGDGFALITPHIEESLGVTTTTTSVQKLQLAVSGPLAEGNYDLSAAAEIRTQTIISGSYACVRVLLDSSEIAHSNNPNDMFEMAMLEMTHFFNAGAQPVVEIVLEAVGTANTVEIQNARLSLKRSV